MEIGLWSDEQLPGPYLEAFRVRVRRGGHVVREFRSVEGLGQYCERERQREPRATGVLIASGSLPPERQYTRFLSRGVVDSLLEGVWPARLHYLIAVVDLDTSQTETVVAVGGREVSKSLGITSDAEDFGASAWDDLSRLLASIDERAERLQSTQTECHLLPLDAVFRGAMSSYRVVRRLGRGGTAEVYEVEDESGTHRAAKLLSPHRFEITAAMKARFAREVATMRDLDHRNIVTAVDEAQYAEAPVLVMELLSESLHDRFRQATRPDFSHLVAWAGDALRGLDALHAVGGIHRDVSPKNLLLRSDGTLVLADFGTTRNVLDEAITQSDEGMGSLLYVSPQQFENAHSATAADDIYSLGQVLWEAATGQRPLRTTHPLRVLRPDLPEVFADLVDHMRSDRSGDRPSAKAALAKLERVRKDEPEPAVPPSEGDVATGLALSEAATRRLAAGRGGDEALFHDVSARPSPAVVQQALVRAEALRVVSRRLPRVPLFDTPYLVRFVPTARDGGPHDPAVVHVVLETRDGEAVETFEWHGEMTAVDLCEAIGVWLIERERYPGDAAFQPGQMFLALGELLRRARARVSGSAGITLDLAPVIQLFGSADAKDLWWVTDAGLQRDDLMFTYTIEKDRFEELDWDQHVTPRSGVDPSTFRQAFETAKALRARNLL